MWPQRSPPRMPSGRTAYRTNRFSDETAPHEPAPSARRRAETHQGIGSTWHDRVLLELARQSTCGSTTRSSSSSTQRLSSLRAIRRYIRFQGVPMRFQAVSSAKLLRPWWRPWWRPRTPRRRARPPASAWLAAKLPLVPTTTWTSHWKARTHSRGRWHRHLEATK